MSREAYKPVDRCVHQETHLLSHLLLRIGTWLIPWNCTSPSEHGQEMNFPCSVVYSVLDIKWHFHLPPLPFSPRNIHAPVRLMKLGRISRLPPHLSSTECTDTKSAWNSNSGTWAQGIACIPAFPLLHEGWINRLTIHLCSYLRGLTLILTH